MNHKRGILIEGVSGIGKTSILKRIRQLLAEERSGSTTLFFSEHYTERVLEDQRALGTLTYDAVLEYIENRLMPILEGACQLQDQSKFVGRAGNGMIHIILERWLGSMFSNLLADGIPLPKNLDSLKDRGEKNIRKIIDLGIQPVILTLPSQSIETVIRSTMLYRNEAWSTYINKIEQQYGVEYYFSNWQKFLIEQYTALEGVYHIKVESPVTLAHYDDLAREIYDLLHHKT